jgi:hypothetical protein
LSIGLVDSIGYLQDAIDSAKGRAKLAEAQVISVQGGRGIRREHLLKAGAAPTELSL